MNQMECTVTSACASLHLLGVQTCSGAFNISLNVLQNQCRIDSGAKRTKLNVSPPVMVQFEALSPALSLPLAYPPCSPLPESNEGSLVIVHDYHTNRIISH